MSYYDDYPDDIFDESELFFDTATPNFSEIYENCVVPSAQQFFNYVATLLFYGFLFRFLTSFAQRVQYLRFSIHLISVICGNFVLISIIGSSVFYYIAFIYCIYFAIIVLTKWHGCNGILGYIMGVLCMTIMVSCEIFEWNPTVWRQIRGVQMVATMKIVSLAFDMDGYNSDKLKFQPDILSYLGYMFCPSNCVLGPWGPYSEYISVATKNKLIDGKTVFWAITNFISTFFFAMSSNCLVPMLISNDSWKWLIAYRDALSFRCSHYFVSFASQLTMVVSGFASHSNSLNYSKFFGYQVVKPLSMEMPRSLTEVVTDWNISIHNWLKQYVFRVARHKSVPFAILLTYIVSSMLHGLNFHLAAVLLSLGIFSLIEHNFRANIAEYLNACVRANACRNCDHALKRFSPIAAIINTLFSGFTIIHLAFLGTIFNSSSSSGIDEDFSFISAWNKWSDLNFASYWICFGCLICNILLKI